MNRYQQKHRGYQVQQAASAPQPNCLVKLTPTGSACWYPPLRSGAAYRGRKTATLAGARFPGGRAQVPWALAPCAARAAGCGGHEERLFLHGVTVTRRTGKWLNAEKARAAPEAGLTHRRLAGMGAAKGAPVQRSVKATLNKPSKISAQTWMTQFFGLLCLSRGPFGQFAGR